MVSGPMEWEAESLKVCQEPAPWEAPWLPGYSNKNTRASAVPLSR